MFTSKRTGSHFHLPILGLTKLRMKKPAQIFARMWCNEDTSLREISLGFNDVYRFERDGIGYFLRVANPRFRSLQDVVRSTDFLLVLAETGAPVCEPIASRSGRWIEELELDGVDWIAGVTQEIPGPPLSERKLDAPLMQSLGAALAQLHLASSQYEPAPGLEFVSWRNLWRETNEHLGEGDQELQAIAASLDAWLQSRKEDPKNFGLTHGDLRLANVILAPRGPVMIDFDEPVWHWYAADLARILIDVHHNSEADAAARQEALVRGYRQHKPLSPADVDDLPRFMAMKELDRYTFSRATETAQAPELEAMRALILRLSKSGQLSTP